MDNFLPENYHLSESTLKQLQHPLRQKILQTVDNEGETTSKNLERSLGIASGTLYYHLNILKGLLEQNEEKKYRLSSDGIQALNYLYSTLDFQGFEGEKNLLGKFNQLSHSVRRQILLLIDQEGDFGISYTDLLEKLKLASGTLFYHLKYLKGLIELNNEKNYCLTKSGIQMLNDLFQYLETSGVPLTQIKTWKEKGEYQEIINKSKPSLDNLETTYLIIEAYIETGDVEKAESIVKKILSQDSTLTNKIYFNYYRAKCLIPYEEFQKAEKFLKNGLDLLKNPKFKSNKYEILKSNFKLHLGESLWRQHKLESGISIFRKLLEEIGDDKPQIKGLVHDNLSAIYWIQGNDKEAYFNLKQALEHFQVYGSEELVKLAQNKMKTLFLNKEQRINESEFSSKFKEIMEDFEIKD
ncbi:MAG: hypothetical protein ACW981_06165 [Candidatus Hodarchaeales archaeon]